MEWNNSVFISSVKKIDLNLLLIVVLDALFYISSAYLVIFWLQRVQAKMAAFNLPSNILSLGYDRAQQLVTDVRLFYFLIIASFILLLIAIIFLASVIKGIIWAKTTHTKLSFALISRFLVLNLVWMGFWFVLAILVSLLVEPASAKTFMAAAILLGVYFTNALYAIFMGNPNFKSVNTAIRLGIAKIHLFLLPYAVVSLLFFIIVRTGNLLKFKYSSVLLGLIIIIYIALARYYISTVALEIQKLKPT